MTEKEKLDDLLAEKRHQEMIEALNKIIEIQQQTMQLLTGILQKREG